MIVTISAEAIPTVHAALSCRCAMHTVIVNFGTHHAQSLVHQYRRSVMKLFVKWTAILLLGITAGLVLPTSMLAQDKPAEVTITGCLNKADTAGQYVIADEASKKNVTVIGDATLLDRHANNHKVTLTGAMTKDKDKEVFKATKLQMLSVCQ